VCVGGESTHDSASPLQRSTFEASTFPVGAALAQKPKAWSGELRRADAAGATRVAPGVAVAVCTLVVWGEWRLGMGRETIITT
jgi:hypothetical protein